MKLIQSLQRAFDIINCFDEYNEELSLQEISELVNLNINTTRGLVNTLVHYSYLEHNKEKNIYKLGYIFIPKYKLLTQRDNYIVLENIEEFLDNLSNSYQVTSRLHLVKNNTLKKIFSKTPENVRYVLYVKDSKDLPLNATSSGKLILYYADEPFRKKYLDDVKKIKLSEKTKIDKDEIIEELDNIGKNKYSIEVDEVGLGISSVALPILYKDDLVGTISVTGPTQIILENKDEIVIEIQDYIRNNQII